MSETPAGDEIQRPETPAEENGTAEEISTEEKEALRGQKQEQRKSPIREVVETVVVALMIALVIRTFVVEVFVVEGSSMHPNLASGDRLLVNKFVYRFRTPQAGEVIVFDYPVTRRSSGFGRSTRRFIKRVIAVAGDEVEMRDGVVYVNGEPLPEPYNPIRDETSWPPTVVPPQSVWVLGDNRPNSSDSRSFGEVPLDKIKGEAFFRFWPPNHWGSLLPSPREATESLQ